MKNIKKQAVINALLTTIYIVIVGLFMYYATLAKVGRENAYIAPIAMLLLFVFSAALTGYLIVGKPVRLYIDGKKKEAINLLVSTLCFLFVITLISLLLLLFLT